MKSLSILCVFVFFVCSYQFPVHSPMQQAKIVGLDNERANIDLIAKKAYVENHQDQKNLLKETVKKFVPKRKSLESKLQRQQRGNFKIQPIIYQPPKIDLETLEEAGAELVDMWPEVSEIIEQGIELIGEA